MALALACLPGTAWATGNLGCSADDANLSLNFEALFSYDGLSPLFQLSGTIEPKHKKTYATLKKIEIKPATLIQQWFEGDDLKLQFYAETSGEKVPHAYVKLTIDAKKDGEDDFGYHGGYKLEILPEIVSGNESETIKLEGKVDCSAG
jgi:hypothetical protein